MANEQSSTVTVPNTLWCGMKIPIIGLTGPRWSGKTLFASAVDPTNALMIDLESSSETYAIPFKKRVNLYHEVSGRTNGKPPTALDCYLWFKELIAGIKPGEYSNVICDPISDIEAGLTMYVQSHPEDYGHTEKQYEKASGIMWGDLQAGWKLDLGILASRVETFLFTAHLGQVWGTDGKPLPGKTKPKGKSVLMELASLYLEMERKPNNNGIVPSKPIARVLKSRLAVTEFTNGELKFFPVLGGSVPDCDPNKIREYIKSPIGKRQATDAEKAAPEVNLSEDEKLLLKSQIVGEQLQIEQSKSSRMELLAAAAKRNNQAAVSVVSQPIQQPATVATTAATAAEVADKAKRTRRTKEQIEADNAKEAAEKAAKVKTELEGDSTIASPEAAEAIRNAVKEYQESKAAETTATVVTGTPEAPFNPTGETPTVHQVVQAQLAELARANPTQWTADNITRTLNTRFQVDSVMKLSGEQAESLRKSLWDRLTKMGLDGDGMTPKNS